MDTIPVRVQDATPAWLTGVLRRSGVLPRGAVVAARARDNEAFNSTVVHLLLAYSADAPPTAPGAVLLKLNGGHDGAGEVAFYQLVAELPDRGRLPMLARCYGAAYAPESGQSYCLLADRSTTHRAPVTRQQLLAGAGIPAPGCLDGIVEALARFHAYWWEHPRLGDGSALTAVRPWYRDAAHFRRHVERREREWAAFIAAEGAWFPGDLRRLYERALARLPELWVRHLAPRVTTLGDLTLTHGDCYLTQFLCPGDRASSPIYLVDFGDASANFAAYDLAYLLPTFWTPAHRREEGREERLLRRYHRTLEASGVHGYRWDALLADYRLMIALMIFDPVWNGASGTAKAYWWPKMQCLTGAFADWGCAALFDA